MVDIISESAWSRLNKHYTEANEFVEWHYRAVVEDFALFSDLVAEDEEEDTSEAFEEADF